MIHFAYEDTRSFSSENVNLTAIDTLLIIFDSLLIFYFKIDLYSVLRSVSSVWFAYSIFTGGFFCLPKSK